MTTKTLQDNTPAAGSVAPPGNDVAPRSVAPPGGAALKARVLLMESDPILRGSLEDSLRRAGHQLTVADGLPEAIRRLESGAFDVIVADLDMPGPGLSLLSQIRAERPGVEVLAMASRGEVESAVEAMKRGACDCLIKPVSGGDVLVAVQRAIRHMRAVEGDRRVRRAVGEAMQFPTIVSQDYRMVKVFELMDAVASARATVLLCGESGTGKSLVARAIHEHSPRREGPFVEVACGAVPDTLLESELFGHVRGAFTGAVSDSEGRFAAADGGTIFLDEIASASPQLQIKLLRVLQERRFEPIGSNRTREVDVRVLLATHRDLAEEVRRGRFRQDLYYRVNVVSIELPPLRDRTGDIPLLAKHFLENSLADSERTTLGFSPEAMEAMQRYPWPGNVRELENCVERAVVLARSSRIGVEDLPPAFRPAPGAAPSAAQPAGESTTLEEAMEAPQKQAILSALRASGGNRKAAARQLGINRSTLYKKMKKHGIAE